MKEQKEVTLDRDLGLWSALALVIGTIIGAGVFVRQAAVLDDAGSTTMALVAWLAGGLLTITAGLTIAEIASQMPETGGLYVYMERIYGKLWGFLSGWMQNHYLRTCDDCLTWCLSGYFIIRFLRLSK